MLNFVSRRSTTLPAGALVALMMVSGVVSTSPAAAAPPEGDPVPELQPLDQTSESARLNPSPELIDSFTQGRYVVVLSSPPANAGAADARSRTAPDASASQREDERASVADDAGVVPSSELSAATNGFVATLTPDQAARLTLDARVAHVVPDEILPLAGTSTDFLGLSGPGGVWDALGGAKDLGDGVVVGVIDTGIAPENPSFAGPALTTTVDTESPYRDGDEIVFTKSDGGTFRGVCQTGAEFSADDCSTKIIGARYFVDGFDAGGGIGGAEQGEYRSPRDGAGHGSHTASTAAGNAGISTRGSVISGVTPGARIAAYKACWTGPLDWATFDDGCALSDLLAAIDAATSDGVDVINYSIGGGAAATTASLVDQAFLNAASSGIFVAAAAGNSGPEASTLDNASPWITTVAASTIDGPTATVALGDGQAFLGASSTLEAGVTGPLVLGSDIPAEGKTSDESTKCLPGSIDPDAASGAVVVCERGTNARRDKSAEVEAAGGVAMVLLNPTPDSVDADAHTIPTVHLDAAARDAVRAYARTVGATATLETGNPRELPLPPAPQIAGFSSRGPVLADGSDVLKPDIAAPGTTVLAAVANAPGADPAYDYLSGTSMASPHIAGLAAMYLSQSPDASPAEIKSALMTSATNARLPSGDDQADPFAQGAGQVVPSAFLDPGLLYLNDRTDWLDYLGAIGLAGDRPDIDASDLNLPSIAIGALSGVQTVTRTLTASRPGTYEARVSGVDGVDVKVEPATIRFDAIEQEQQVRITFTRVDAPLNQFATGYLTWVSSEDGTSVRSPIAVSPTPFVAPEAVYGVGATGSVQIDTIFGADAEHALSTVGLVRGSRTRDFGSVGGEPNRYSLSLTAPASLLLIDLSSEDGQTPLGLRVLGVSEDGSVFPLGEASESVPSHRAILREPVAGDYIVEVVFPEGTSGASFDYGLTTYVLGGDGPERPFDTDPEVLEGTTGQQVSLSAEWSDLPAGAYLGSISYGETGASTLVTVDAGTPPVVPGTPELTVSPSASEWTLAGGMVQVSASGLTPGGRYTVSIEDRVTRDGLASEDGTVEWGLSLPADLAAGEHSVHLRGPDADLTEPFRVTSGYVYRGSARADPLFNGDTAVVYQALVEGGGDVRVRVVHSESKEVIFDGLATDNGDPRERFTPSFLAPQGQLEATATVEAPDGSGPVYTYEPFEVAPHTSSTITVDPDQSTGFADVVIDNELDIPEDLAVIYQGCDGTRVIGYDNVEPGRSDRVWDIAGYVSISVIDSEDIPVFSWQNDGGSRCGARASELRGHDLWVTQSDPAVTGDSAAAALVSASHPVAGRVSYRYEPQIDEYSLTVGQGDRTSAPLFPVDGDATVPVEPTGERGRVSSTDIALAEGAPTWLDLVVFDEDPVWLYLWMRLNVPSVSLEDLQREVAGDVTAGIPTITGAPQVGQTLTVDPGMWNPSNVLLSHQWLLNGEPIPGATSRELVVPFGAEGGAIAARVTGVSATGASASATSSALVIGPTEDTVDVTLKIDSTRKKGRVVLSGSATNLGGTDVTLTAKTPFGDVRLGTLESGESKTVRVDTHLRRVPAGSVAITATAPDGTARTYVVRYEGSR